jgi:hypothetical protein
MKRLLLVSMLGLLTACSDPNAGEAAFGLSFSAPDAAGGWSGSCRDAKVTSVRFRFYDQTRQDEPLRTEVIRPCVADDKYRVAANAGFYRVSIQGLNDHLTPCYEIYPHVNIHRGETVSLNYRVTGHPVGIQAGCLYPSDR